MDEKRDISTTLLNLKEYLFTPMKSGEKKEGKKS